MRNIATFLLATLGSALCYAELSVSDLPFIEGTPLEQSNDTALNWSIVDYQEGEAGYSWVWLQNDAQQAYLVYPEAISGETFTFPDATNIPVVSERVNLSFIGEPEQQIEITRFSGKITLDGAVIRLSYTPADVELTDSGNEYRLSSNNQLDVSFISSNFVSEGGLQVTGNLSINTSGGITTVSGTSGIDFLISETSTSNTWTITEADSGNVSIGNVSIGNLPSLINFESIESLVGGSGVDNVLISGSLSSSIDGGDGNDTLTGHDVTWNPSPTVNSCNSTENHSGSVTVSSEYQSQSPAQFFVGATCTNNVIDFSNIQLGENSIHLSEFSLTTLEEQMDTTAVTASQRKKKSWAGASSESLIAFMLLLLICSRLVCRSRDWNATTKAY